MPIRSLSVPLSVRPAAALFAIGIHGPSAAERHQVGGHWCLHLYTYSARIVIWGEEHEIKPGYAGILPPGADTVYAFPTRSIHACAHFSFPEEQGSPLVDMPLLQDLGPRFPEIYRDFEEAIACFHASPTQAEVRLWDILWRLAKPVLAKPGELNRKSYHPAVMKTMETIELRLSEALSIPDLAIEAELSHNQLTRLFRAAVDTTVIGFIQERRSARAGHLIINSSLPMKTIAAQVGLDDSRLFNKLIHKYLGASPTAVRERSRS